MEYLKAKELKRLLKIPTTVKEAKQIKRRNEGLLQDIDEDTRGKSRSVGCAHCVRVDNAYKCSACRWQIGKPNTTFPLFACCAQEFAGISHEQLGGHLFLAHDEEQLVDLYSISDPMRNDLHNYLMAHIEWADAVIQKGGV